MPDGTVIAAHTGGDTIATDDITGGVADQQKVQRVKVGHGTDGSYTDASASAPLPVAVTGSAAVTGTVALTGTPGVRLSDGTNQANVIAGDAGQSGQAVAGMGKSVAFTTGTAAAVGATDALNYCWVAVHIVTQGTSSTVTFQASNDNVNWFTLTQLTSTSTAGPAAGTTTATGGFHGPLPWRYFRLNVTGISAGTTAGVIVFSAVPAALQGMAVTVSNTPAVTVSGTPAVAVASGSTVTAARATVTTAGTRVQLGVNAGILAVTVRARPGNAGIVYVGGSGVTSANGFELQPGESISFDVTNTNAVWVDAATSGDGVDYVWVLA